MTHTELLTTDTTYARIVAEYRACGDALDTAYDGALHHRYDARTADAMVDRIEWQYDRAAAAFYEYRANAGI